MTNQVVVYFNNGTKDWIDPVTDDSFSFTDTSIIINNGFNIYEYNKADVMRMLMVESDKTLILNKGE